MHSVTIPVDFNTLLEQKSATLVVAHFYSPGYDPCTSVQQILKQAQSKYENVTFVHIDANSAHELAKEYYKVTTVPTCLFFKEKKVVYRHQGVEEEEIQKLLEKNAVPEPQENSEPPSDEPTEKPSEESTTPVVSLPAFNFSEGFLQGLWNPQMLKEAGPSSLPPKYMLDDICTQLSIAFGPGIQSRAARCDKETPLSEPTLTLYCPLEGGEYVIDAAVQALAERHNANIQMLDLSQLANEQWSNVWTDLIKTHDSACSCTLCTNDKAVRGYFSGRLFPDAEKMTKLVEQLLGSVPPNEVPKTPESEKQRRIIYVRDFGVVATLAPSLYRSVLATIQKTLPNSEVDGVNPIPTVIVLGTAPFLKEPGLFQTGSSSLYGWASSDPSNRWDESSDAQTAREERNQQQYRMWKDGSLLKHIESHLLETNVFSGVTESGDSRYKYSRTCILVPTMRDLAKECASREKIRLNINHLGIRMGLLSDGAELSMDSNESQEATGALTKRCRSNILVANEIQPLVDRTMITATGETTTQDSKFNVTWDTLSTAWEAQTNLDQERSNWIKNSTPKEGEDQSKGDDLVEQVKKMDLSQYEKDMLRCLVKPDQLRTTFESVHLPAETIDVVRSLVSLPLICPGAFQTGLLKEYNMTGALFFGPPGTGKTHLARAIAKESGARMISVKPSDIMDKYVGESEKIISGLFQLARRLKPCIVFIDEIDSLFGARTSKSCSPWRTDMLTQFAQEMDGMHVSDVVVIGTTNRPFDLDDAMVRRLSCRILVDLPDEAAREAIMKILLRNEKMEDDVDLKQLARLTSRYSGSDLKSLCVMAAYESAKELAQVPWSTSKTKASTSLFNQQSFAGTLTPSPTDSGRESPSGSALESIDPEVTGDVQGSKPTTVSPELRTLAKRHFTHALSQVRASTSESQESFVQLRKWNEQFGSANQRKKVEIDALRAHPLPNAAPGSYLRQLGVVKDP